MYFFLVSQEIFLLFLKSTYTRKDRLFFWCWKSSFQSFRQTVICWELNCSDNYPSATLLTARFPQPLLDLLFYAVNRLSVTSPIDNQLKKCYFNMMNCNVLSINWIPLWFWFLILWCTNISCVAIMSFFGTFYNSLLLAEIFCGCFWSLFCCALYGNTLVPVML